MYNENKKFVLLKLQFKFMDLGGVDVDVENIILAFLFLIAIIVPPQKNMGVNGFAKNWDHYIESPSKKLIVPRLIQIRYCIGKSKINIITYISFMVDFANWLICILMFPAMLVFKDDALKIAILIFAITYMIINLPIGIARTICVLKVSKKQRFTIQSEEYDTAISIVETTEKKRTLAYRNAIRQHKEYVNIIEPFLKDFERCISKENGKAYISEDNLKWAIDKIFPKYKKRIFYSISNEEPQNRLLIISLTRDNRVITKVKLQNLR